MLAAAHLANPGENKFGVTMIFIDGMTMCFTLCRSEIFGSLSAITRPGIGAKHSSSLHPTAAFTVSTLSGALAAAFEALVASALCCSGVRSWFLTLAPFLPVSEK